MHAGQITGAEAVRARTEVMDTYRRLPILDPQLPARLLPPGWLRVPARSLFAALYDGLAETAEDHVRAVGDPLHRRPAARHPHAHRRRAGRRPAPERPGRSGQVSGSMLSSVGITGVIAPAASN